MKKGLLKDAGSYQPQYHQSLDIAKFDCEFSARDDVEIFLTVVASKMDDSTVISTVHDVAVPSVRIN